MKNKRGIQGAHRLFRVQLVTMLVISSVVFVVSGIRPSASVLLGGLVSIVTNGHFAWIMFRYHGAKNARKIVNSFYKGEAIKMLLTVCLFALIFKNIKVVPLAFFAGFIVAQMMIWFAPLIFDNKRK